MTVLITPLGTTASETYTTSAKVGRSVDTAALAAISAQALTDCIVYAQNEIDAWLADDYTVPFSTVPDLVQEMARDLASAEVIKRTLSLGSGTAGGTEKMRAFRENAIANLRLVASGELDLYASGTLVSRLLPEDAVTLVTPATPAASMTIVTGMDTFELREYQVEVRLAAASGTPTGKVTLTGTLDEGREESEDLYFSRTGYKTARKEWLTITNVASSITGGTTPTLGVFGVKPLGKIADGGRS